MTQQIDTSTDQTISFPDPVTFNIENKEYPIISNVNNICFEDTSFELNQSKQNPLFEQPEKLPDGSKRKRKATSRLKEEIRKEEAVMKQIKLDWQPPRGTGLILYNIPEIAKNVKELERLKEYENIKVLYKFLYNQNCQKQFCVNRILKFRGLNFTVDDKTQSQRHAEMIGLFRKNDLQWTMKQFCIKEPKHRITVDGDKTKKMKITKEELIEASMTWLYKPSRPEKTESDVKSCTLTSNISDSTISSKPQSTPRPPKPSVVKNYIHRLLKDADMEKVTMKNICNQVYDRWPLFRERMMSRKKEIKNVIKEYIASN